MFEEYIKRMLGNERAVIQSRQENKNIAEPDVIEEKTAEMKEEVIIPRQYRDDINTLQNMYGGNFKTGLCINLTLKQALEIIPRERLRIDAYTGLISFLKSKMGISLNITSQKTKGGIL